MIEFCILLIISSFLVQLYNLHSILRSLNERSQYKLSIIGFAAEVDGVDGTISFIGINLLPFCLRSVVDLLLVHLLVLLHLHVDLVLLLCSSIQKLLITFIGQDTLPFNSNLNLPFTFISNDLWGDCIRIIRLSAELWELNSSIRGKSTYNAFYCISAGIWLP